MNGAQRNGTALHDAFISYSRKDLEFARILEKALEGFRPPKELLSVRRRLDIFRDEDDFTGVNYHESVARHLQDSAALIVICSPDAARSPYVDEEIRRFAQDDPKRRDKIIPVLYRGIPNNEVALNRQDERAFPTALCDLLGMPLAVNYLQFHPQKISPTKARSQARGSRYWQTSMGSAVPKSKNARGVDGSALYESGLPPEPPSWPVCRSRS